MSWLIMYLIGVFLMIILIIISNRKLKFKDIKWTRVLLTFIYVLGSWIMITYIAFASIIEES